MTIHHDQVASMHSDTPSGSGESVWIDLEAPSESERQRIAEVTGEPIPTQSDIEEFEASSRFFMSEHAVHLRAFFLSVDRGVLVTVPLAFLVTDANLITIHWSPLRTISTCQQQPHAGDEHSSPWAIVIELFETHIDTLADEIESLYAQVNSFSTVLSTGIDQLSSLITDLGRIEERNEKLRFSLLDQQQTLANLNRHQVLPDTHHAQLVELLSDIRSLIDHSEGILNRISLHASMIMSRSQVADSQITKAFSVVATLFLPPTLIASIYGMNFKVMPELDWFWGYAVALGAMVLSSIVPFAYFKFKRWL